VWAIFWNRITWAGRTELRFNAPERDLDRLLADAERALDLSEQRDGAMPDTLARPHWKLGAAAVAIEVQRETVVASEAALAALDDAADGEGRTARRRAAMAKALAEIRATLCRYEREKATNRDGEACASHRRD
jgi:hypothetical protein